MSELLKAHISKRIDITEAEWNEYYSLFTPRSLKKKEILMKAGELCTFQVYITKGCLRTFFTDAKDHDHAMQFGFEDWWAGDLLAFITEKPAYYSVDALEDSEVLVAEKADLVAFYDRNLKFEKYFRILIQSAYVASQQRIIATMSQSAEERYLDLVKKYPTLEMRVAQHHIASYLGITPEALSRIKRNIIEKSRTVS